MKFAKKVPGPVKGHYKDANQEKPYSQRLQESVAEIFLRMVEEKDAEIARLLQKKLDIAEVADKPSRRAKNEALLVSIPREKRNLFEEMNAKLVDMQWRARKVGGINVLNALAEVGVKTGDTFDEVIGRLKENSVPATKVQELVDELKVWPSLTTHPTNPTSLDYTLKGLAVDKALADPATQQKELEELLRSVLDTQMDETPNDKGERKKTPEKEATELLAILDVIYDSAAGPEKRLRTALDQNGYTNVEIKNPLLDLNVWGPGDGDGNPNMTAEVLAAFVTRAKTRIQERYLEEIKEFVPALRAENYGKAADDLAAIGARLGSYGKDEARLQADVRAVVAQVGKDAKIHGMLDDFETKVETFGTRFTRIDVRHNSKDLMTTVGRVLEATYQIGNASDFMEMDADKQAALIKTKFNDAEFLEPVKALDPQTMIDTNNGEDKDGQTAMRVLTRMRVMAENPEMFQKLIIAETTSAANGLAALLMLKAAGNEVANDKASVDVVPLFESRKDLEEAPKVVHTLCTDEVFGAHVRARGYMLSMIAKSDTARLSGPGVQGQQEETAGKILALNRESYGAAMYVMLGGGDDQMRGGGRIVETPHVMLRAEAREGGHYPAKLAMTVQGLQLQLIFGSSLLAENFQESFAAQSMLANARATGLVEWRPVPQGVNETQAYLHAKDYFREAMDRYEQAIGYKGSPARETIKAYFRSFPSEIIEWTNKSSRPGARTKTTDPIEGRAISLDQRSKHDGAYLTATVGLVGALEHLAGMPYYGGKGEDVEPISALRHAYMGNKSFRDNIRMQAVILHQKDYDMAWMKHGRRPTEEEAESLALAYNPTAVNEPRVFLAALEKADHREAMLIYEAITGEKPAPGISLKAPLEAGWPNLAEQMDHRERQSEWAKLMEVYCINKIKKCHEDREHIPDWLRELAVHAYVGANPTYSSPSFILTMTDPQKEGKEQLSERNDRIEASLKMPQWSGGRGVAE
jgi:phosphoenolpyruvate carboxylase